MSCNQEETRGIGCNNYPFGSQPVMESPFIRSLEVHPSSHCRTRGGVGHPRCPPYSAHDLPTAPVCQGRPSRRRWFRRRAQREHWTGPAASGYLISNLAESKVGFAGNWARVQQRSTGHSRSLDLHCDYCRVFATTAVHRSFKWFFTVMEWSGEANIRAIRQGRFQGRELSQIQLAELLELNPADLN
jgi:hypothetical protein